MKIEHAMNHQEELPDPQHRTGFGKPFYCLLPLWECAKIEREDTMKIGGRRGKWGGFSLFLIMSNFKKWHYNIVEDEMNKPVEEWKRKAQSQSWMSNLACVGYAHTRLLRLPVHLGSYDRAVIALISRGGEEFILLLMNSEVHIFEKHS